MEEALRLLALSADKKGIELLCDIGSDVPEKLKGDSARLRQVLLNLISNAVKFTAVGEVVVRVAMAEDGNVQFTVEDTGIGITPEKQESIFDPFTQADSSTTRTYGGTGLGLTISARLVSMMGGNIWLTSEVGRGSQFHFTVKMGEPEGGSEPSAELPLEKLRGMKVLIVDDSATNRTILLGLLKHWQMRTGDVESAELAIAELLAAKAADPYQLILTDMHMPNMDGFELIEQIRNTQGLSTAAVMMLTSGGFQADVERCKQLGIAAYLLKPIHKRELLNAVLKVLVGVAPSAPKAAPSMPVSNALRLHILLAEDNRVNQIVACRLLEKLGHTVVLAMDGNEALSLWAGKSFDLIMMDVQMPETDGFTATRTIREKEMQSGTHTPIIALTAHAMTGDRQRCFDAGMDGYVTKPISILDLEKAIAGVAPYLRARQ